MLIVHAEDQQVVVTFPGGVVLELSLVGKSLDVRATVHGRSALLRTELEDKTVVTLDIFERRAPEE